MTWHIWSPADAMPAVHPCYCLKMIGATSLQPCLSRPAQQGGAQAPCPELQTTYEICPACRCLGSSSATLWCSFSSSRRGQLSSSGSGLTLRITAAPVWGTPYSQQVMSLANAAVVRPLRCAGGGRMLTVHVPAGQGRGFRQMYPAVAAWCICMRQQGRATVQAVATSSGGALTVHVPAGLGAA